MSIPTVEVDITAEAKRIIDEALVQIKDRTIIPQVEMVNVLLDARLALATLTGEDYTAPEG